MKTYRLFAFASIIVATTFAGCSNDQEKGIGAYRVSDAVVRNTSTNCQQQYTSNAIVGITEDQQSFYAYDTSGVMAFCASPLKRESKGVWSGTDEKSHERYTVIFNDTQDQYLFSVTLSLEKTCVIYVIPKGNDRWSTWADYRASATQHHYVDLPPSERHDGTTDIHRLVPGSGL